MPKGFINVSRLSGFIAKLKMYTMSSKAKRKTKAN